jgi:hypothetical protein
VATKKRKLLTWHGSEVDITIGKTYSIDVDTNKFVDNVGFPRPETKGVWGPVEEIETRDGSKYDRPVKGVTIDVYDVLEAFNVTCPALQHLIKKALCVGLRGHKSPKRDLKDIVESANRAHIMGTKRTS